MNQPDWSRPQRQPIAGLGIVFLNTFWEVIKRLWPFLILMLIGDRNKEGVNRYELLALFFLLFTIISAILNFIYFKFHIEDDKLVIKKGWFKKETKVIPLNKIQTVNIEQGPLHQVLNIVKLSIDTAGSQKAEATIDALHKHMAEALRQQLVAEVLGETETGIQPEPALPLVKLHAKDLLKLSISANHLEAFFILLSFGIGLYDNLKDINKNLFPGIQDIIPESSLMPILMLMVLVLLVTIVFSTTRIFLRFWDLTVMRTQTGFSIQSGLTNIRNRLVSLPKIQFISWKSNWIRKLMGLWMLQYHVAGGDELKNKLTVQVPVTRYHDIPVLSGDYHPLPSTADQIFVRMHPSFIYRRVLAMGILPSLLIIPLLWWIWNETALFYLIVPIAIGITAWFSQRKFRLWAMDDVLYIKKGIFGEERILVKWYKCQSVQLSQSIYQRRKGLANLTLHTAGGRITIYFIPLSSAYAILNFAIYKTEISKDNWQ